MATMNTVAKESASSTFPDAAKADQSDAVISPKMDRRPSCSFPFSVEDLEEEGQPFWAHYPLDILMDA